MKIKAKALLLMLVCTLLASSAQVLSKIGANGLSFDFSSINYLPLVLVAVLNTLSTLLIIFALKGGEVTVLYSIMSSSYVFVTIASSWFFGDIVGLIKWIGIFFIIFGILAIIFSSKNEAAVK